MLNTVAPKCLHARLSLWHAANERTKHVLWIILPLLVKAVAELLGSLKCLLDGAKRSPTSLLLDLGWDLNAFSQHMRSEFDFYLWRLNFWNIEGKQNSPVHLLGFLHHMEWKTKRFQWISPSPDLLYFFPKQLYNVWWSVHLLQEYTRVLEGNIKVVNIGIHINMSTNIKSIIMI